MQILEKPRQCKPLKNATKKGGKQLKKYMRLGIGEDTVATEQKGETRSIELILFHGNEGFTAFLIL